MASVSFSVASARPLVLLDGLCQVALVELRGLCEVAFRREILHGIREFLFRHRLFVHTLFNNTTWTAT